MTITYPDLSRCGRLGNQLWQIAATVGIAERLDQEPLFPPWDYEPFFSVPPTYFTDTWPSPALAGDQATQHATHLDPRARPYLQDLSLFVEAAERIHLLFRPSGLAVEILTDIWDNQGFGGLENVISVHVRRGDNVTHPQGYHPLRSMEYYRAALEHVGDGDVVVFSDDPEWCRENFAAQTGRDVALFYEGTARPREYADRAAYENAPVLDWIDLQLMAACDRHVLSNSTYAWWGAYLSADFEAVYPSNWFGRHVAPYTDASIMFPANWVEIYDATEGGI